MKNPHDPSLAHVAKITLAGTAFIGAGALLTTYVPAFHKPVEMIEKALDASQRAAAKTPYIGKAIENNPFMKNRAIKEFLSINVFETVLTTALIATIGSVVGIARPRQSGSQQHSR